MGERLSAEDREAALATWFTENLTWEHFRDWGDEEWARNLLAEVERLVAAAVAEERERIATAIEAVFTNPERLRPKAPDTQVRTDFASDWQWCQMIARSKP